MASLVEGYAKTHLGVWGITAGRQPMSWGVGRAGQLAFGSNATPQTAIKLNLLEPHTFDNGALKFLGKASQRLRQQAGGQQSCKFRFGAGKGPCSSCVCACRYYADGCVYDWAGAYVNAQEVQQALAAGR